MPELTNSSRSLLQKFHVRRMLSCQHYFQICESERLSPNDPAEGYLQTPSTTIPNYKFFDPNFQHVAVTSGLQSYVKRKCNTSFLTFKSTDVFLLHLALQQIYLL